MPKVMVSGVIVTCEFDDNNTSDTVIRCGRDEGTGPYVSVERGENTVYLRPETWPKIRDHIQDMFDEMEREDSR